MGFNRDLWADAYKFYQRQAQLLEGSRGDLPTFFCNLAQEISKRSRNATQEGKALWNAVYTMIESRSKEEPNEQCDN